MLGACIAATTAFLDVNAQAAGLPRTSMIVWLAPTIAGTPAIAIWSIEHLALRKKLTTVRARQRSSLRLRRARRHEDVKAQWFVPRRHDSDVVWAGREVEVMEIAAELFDKTKVSSVDEHLAAAGIDVELHPTDRRAVEWRFVHVGYRVARIQRDGKPGAPRPEGKRSQPGGTLRKELRGR